jgi:hypothetical protein
MFRPGGLRLSAQPIGATVNASPASTRVTTHDWGHCGSLLFDVRLFHPLPCAVSQRPENVRTQFLSLLQSLTRQTFSVEFRAAKKASFRAVLRIRLGVRYPERYEKSLSERPSLSEARGLADLLYKLLYQLSQHLSLIPLP